MDAESASTGCVALAAVVVAAFLVLPLAFVFGGDVVDYVAPQRFTAEGWAEAERSLDNGLSRWQMRHSLERQHDLVGMTRGEVEALLGPGYFHERSQTLGYALGPTRHGINVGVLELTFEAGTVIRYAFRES